MKNKILYFWIAIGIGMIGCTQNETNAPQNNTSKSESVVTEPQGQALVDDGVSAKNILQVAIGSKDHTTLVAAVQAAQLENVLANNGPLTVFAPTNAAFDLLPEGTVEDLLKPENQTKLRTIITFHASPGSYDIDALKDGMKLYQATGHYVDVVNKDGKVTVAGANILGTVKATNGIIHVVDKVLLPPSK